MNKKGVKAHSSLSIVIFLLVTSIFGALTLGGCASTQATTGPGKPDEMQLQHYEMVKSAIEIESKTDALAALALLQSDVSQWQTNTAVIMKAFVDQSAITDAVDAEDWVTVNKLFKELTATYRNY